MACIAHVVGNIRSLVRHICTDVVRHIGWRSLMGSIDLMGNVVRDISWGSLV